jgi:hypothetical protein
MSMFAAPAVPVITHSTSEAAKMTPLVTPKNPASE